MGVGVRAFAGVVGWGVYHPHRVACPPRRDAWDLVRGRLERGCSRSVLRETSRGVTGRWQRVACSTPSGVVKVSETGQQNGPVACLVLSTGFQGMAKGD